MVSIDKKIASAGSGRLYEKPVFEKSRVTLQTVTAQGATSQIVATTVSG